jgi:hypothetical protein
MKDGARALRQAQNAAVAPAFLWRRENFRRGIIRERKVVLKAEFGQRAQSQTYGQRYYHQ